MNRVALAKELLAVAKELSAMDFSTQKQMDEYLKDHPDADRSKHRVVKQDPSKPETHPVNLMQQRKNEKRLDEIGKALKKDPKDLTVKDITDYNSRKSSETEVLAEELVRVAGGLVAMEFPTQEALDKYLKDHPDADRSNYKVVETKRQAPAKKGKPLSRDEEDQVAEEIRGHLSKTDRYVTKETMYAVLGRGRKRLTEEQFGTVWDSMVKDGYLKKTGGGYRWNDEGEFSAASELAAVARELAAGSGREVLDEHLRTHRSRPQNWQIVLLSQKYPRGYARLYHSKGETQKAWLDAVERGDVAAVERLLAENNG